MSVNETTEMWRDHRHYVQDRRWEGTYQNGKILRASGIPGEFRNMETVFIIRAKGWPRVDFWPPSGMWLDHKTKKRHYGDADAFVAWCRKEAK